MIKKTSLALCIPDRYLPAQLIATRQYSIVILIPTVPSKFRILKANNFLFVPRSLGPNFKKPSTVFLQH